MSKYIDCENCYHGKVCAERHIYHDMIVSCPHHIPTADVVEVVRCKDCGRSAKYKDYYLCGVDNRAVNADSFCSYGERRTDDDV